MIKKPKKKPIYSVDQKKFNTFKEMKTFVWYNSHTDEEIQGFEMIENQKNNTPLQCSKKQEY